MFTVITDTRFGPLMTQIPGLNAQARAQACRTAIAEHRKALVASGLLDDLAARREAIHVAVCRFTKPQVAIGQVAA